MNIELEHVNKEGIVSVPSFAAGRGTVTSVLGDNGSGKTSLLKLISGLYIPESGQIKFFDYAAIDYSQNPNFLAYHKLHRYLRNHLIYIENFNLFYDDVSVVKNLAYYLKLNKIRFQSVLDPFNKLADELRIKEGADAIVSTLSRGTKQKLVLILALLSNKEIIVLDEPTSALDEESARIFYSLLADSKKTLLLSTHDKKLAEQYSDSIYRAENGRITKEK